jgi:hypothetical protein
MKMRTLLFFIFLTMSSQIFSQEEDAEDSGPLIDALVTAKATGMCGVFSQMVNFQEATKMPGGDEFIVRFLNTEAARLGHTLETFMQSCITAADNYAATMKTLEAGL